jgi:hypothetical protein
MAEQQVYSEVEAFFGKQYAKLFWPWSAPNNVVPPNKILEITTLTLNYFPDGGGTVGRECERCAKISWQKRLHGLFKTEREAEKDFEATALKLTEGWHGVSH